MPGNDEEVTTMVSKALASRDAWLELAERVLEERQGDELLAIAEPSHASLPSEGGGDQ